MFQNMPNNPMINGVYMQPSIPSCSYNTLVLCCVELPSAIGSRVEVFLLYYMYLCFSLHAVRPI